MVVLALLVGLGLVMLAGYWLATLTEDRETKTARRLHRLHPRLRRASRRVERLKGKVRKA